LIARFSAVRGNLVEWQHHKDRSSDSRCTRSVGGDMGRALSVVRWDLSRKILLDMAPTEALAVVRECLENGRYVVTEHVARRMEVIANFQAHSVELTRPDGRSLRVMGVPVLVDDKPEGMILLQEDITERKNYQATLENLAATDYLTGLMNRGAFFKAAEREIDRARRFGHSSGLILLDIDYFKRVNDKYGHPAGDEVLRQLAETSRGLLREQDLIGRLGGEEFAILLVQPPANKLHDIAERLRAAIDELIVEHQGERISITASLGIAETGDTTDNLERLIATADELLYTAKREGRNRVCATESQSP